MAKSKTTKKTGTKRSAAAPTDYTKAKLEVQGRCKIGATFVYNGINPAFKGKKVEVTGHESRGGVFIKVGAKTLTCSPFALLERPDSDKAKGKAKAAPNATKAKGKPKPGKKSSETPGPAPAAALEAAPEAPSAPKAKARKAA